MDYNSLTEFYRGKRVLITGNTGFKGSWLTLLLHKMGAHVFGYSQEPPTSPSLYNLANLAEICQTQLTDIRDFSQLKAYIETTSPEIIIHMAAQPLVRDSYNNPRETYEVNVMGTVNLMEAVRNTDGIKVVLNITTDKCYENKEWHWGYRENDRLGGYDPYSNSKACSELVSAAFRTSYFSNERTSDVMVATARAGNVIGGGDWAMDRLIPDFMRAITDGKKVKIRNPHAIRPWQHVLEPLTGYLLLIQKLYEKGREYTGAWNFGPDELDAKPVEWIVKTLCKKWGDGAGYEIDGNQHPHEASYLKLDCSKAKTLLGWHPAWNLEKAIDNIIDFYKIYMVNGNLKNTCNDQIEAFFNDCKYHR